MEKKQSSGSVRNVGIIAHIDAGKTTTSERILFYTGRSHRLGEVDQGNTVMDWMEEEQNRGITIVAAATTCYWRQQQINFIDTPGHVDFTVEVERSLRVLDGAVILLCAVKGIEAQSETVWRQANHYQIPRLVYINKMDRIGANEEQVCQQLIDRFAVQPVLLTLPLGRERNYSGNIDLLRMQELTFGGEHGEELVYHPISAAYAERATKARQNLLEILAGYCDHIAEKYLNDEEITSHELNVLLRHLTIERKIIPVLTGSSLKNQGVQPLLDAMIDYLPAPGEGAKIELFNSHNHKEIPLHKLSAEKPLALIFKSQNYPDLGFVHYIRLYHGQIKNGMGLFNTTQQKKERFTRILRMHADHHETITSIKSGDIAALIGLKHSRTGDTLALADMPVLLERPIFPEPVISIAVEATNNEQLEKLRAILKTVQIEDPTLFCKEDEGTGQIVLSGMGELHLEVLLHRLQKEHRLQLHTGTPLVNYRESIGKKAELKEQLLLNAAGKEHFAELHLAAEPLPVGSGVKLNKDAVKKTLTADCLAAVEQGLKSALSSGIVLGYPVIDVQVTVVAATYDEQRSSPLAFESLAAQLLDRLLNKAEPLKLEPIMEMKLSLPSEFFGDVIGHLSQMGAQIHATTQQDLYELVEAKIPLRSTFGYTTKLRSQTQGKGSFSMEFSHFAREQ